MYRSFGSSASGCRTLQRKEGDVVLLLPALSNEGVELLQEQVPKRSLLSVLGDERSKLRKAEHSALGVMGLHQPVAVEQHAATLSERVLPLLIAHPWHKPKRHPSGPEFLGLTVTMQVRQVVASVGVAQGSTLGVQDGVEAGYEHVGRDVRGQRVVDPSQCIPRGFGSLGHGT